MTGWLLYSLLAVLGLSLLLAVHGELRDRRHRVEHLDRQLRESRRSEDEECEGI